MTETSARSDLLALLRERRMLLFVGAGLSLDLGYPLWIKYLDALEQELGPGALEEEQDAKAPESDLLV